MKLVYQGSTRLVQTGDIVSIRGVQYEVAFFRPPHRPSSSGLVTVKLDGQEQEFYVSVIGAEWIEREDRHE